MEFSGAAGLLSGADSDSQTVCAVSLCGWRQHPKDGLLKRRTTGGGFYASGHPGRFLENGGRRAECIGSDNIGGTFCWEDTPLPSGWSVKADAEKAGTDTLWRVEGNCIFIQPRSALILVDETE